MSYNPISMRVMMYDRNPLLAGSIATGLEISAGFTARAHSGDLPSLMAAVPVFRPNILVVDPTQVGIGLDQFLVEVTETVPTCEVLGYVADGARRDAERCLAEGFVGAVSQSRGLEALVDALSVARLGGVFVDPSFAPTGAEAGGSRALPAALSERERFVLEHIARGYSNKEIAGRLDLSAKTVETYKSRALEKLGLRRKSDIVQYALRNDWLSAATATAA